MGNVVLILSQQKAALSQQTRLWRFRPQTPPNVAVIPPWREKPARLELSSIIHRTCSVCKLFRLLEEPPRPQTELGEDHGRHGNTQDV